MGFFDKLFGRSKQHSPASPASPPAKPQRAPVRAVPGALAYANHGGEVFYNLLTPHMQQFMGRCVGAIKKAGIAAKGTGQFSILVGESRAELRLDKFYKSEDNPKLIEDVLHAAQQLNENA
jgi:hypothetical protein